ncbi:MAG: hypothetical protein KGZ74_19840 [Chitinophagaceae bacterium]|nr:hypothetical protein [Chitinophagaceae bacterium]
MKLLYLFCIVQVVQSCNEKAIINQEKSKIKEFVMLVSENKLNLAATKIELPAESQFGMTEYNLKLLQSIFNGNLNLINTSIEKSSPKKGRLDGFTIVSNYYEVSIDPILYDTSLYSNMTMFFLFDRNLNKKNITLFDLRYNQKAFVVPKNDIKIKNIFDDSDTLE